VSTVEPPAVPALPASTETLLRSYTYLRLAMVAGLVALGVSVVWQTGRQHWHLLDSVSAYYFTPAQPIFVGSLIAVGAAMIALRGLNTVEEIFLDLGGMFAFLVPLVPTSRGPDFESAVRLCQNQAGLVLAPGSGTPDCPTVTGLVEATKANVENSIGSLLIVGALSLVAAVLLSPGLRRSYVDRQAPAIRARAATDRRNCWIGFAGATLVFVLTAVAFLFATGWFIRSGHTIGALGLLACIVVVALANAGRTAHGGRALRRSPYSWVAIALVVAAGLGSILWVTGVVTVFWVEIVVALLFATFWTIQTVQERPH
jgi:hypothetical protein